jgi:coproporphyrinogen III oxidase
MERELFRGPVRQRLSGSNFEWLTHHLHRSFRTRRQPHRDDHGCLFHGQCDDSFSLHHRSSDVCGRQSA